MMVFALMSGVVVQHLFHSGLYLALGLAVTVLTGMLVHWRASKIPA